MWRLSLENHKLSEDELMYILDSSSKRSSTLPFGDFVSSDGSSEIYRISLDRRCILLKKTLLHELYDLDQFKSQIALHHRLAKLEHIVPILNCGIAREADLKEYSYILYEFYGEPLSAESAESVQRLLYTAEDCLVLVTSLSKTLEQMQRMQFVHLGLSPHNIIFKDNKAAYIGSLESAISITNLLAGIGMNEYLPLLLGPPAYLAPEFLAYINNREINYKINFNPYCSSVYSIGLIIVQLLTQSTEVKLLGKQPKEVIKLLNKTYENEVGIGKLFIELIIKVLLDPLNENRVDYISLRVLIEIINKNKAELLNEAIPLERTKTQKRIEFYIRKKEKIMNLQNWTKPVPKYLPDLKDFDNFQLQRLFFPVLNITAKQLIIINSDRDTSKTKKVDLKDDIGIGSRICINNDKNIYLLGGHSKDGTTFYGRLWEYTIHPACYTKYADMVTKRSHFGMVNTSPFLFVAGGISDWYTMQSAEYYEKASDQWRQIGILNEMKWCLSLCVCGKSLYCFGGYVSDKGVHTNMNEPKTISTLIERYDLCKFADMWEKIDLGKKTSYVPLAGMCTVAVSPMKILIFGGSDQTKQEKDVAFLFNIVDGIVTCVMTMKYPDSFEQQGYISNGKVYSSSIKTQGEKSAEVFIHSAECIDSSWIWTFKSIKFE